MPEERKLVTVLFADVSGSTVLGSRLDPEDVRALMGRYYDHARRVIAAHAGTLEKFIGDAVMAVFGLPQAHGDDAERALAAALALREAVRADEVLGGRLRLHIGASTGEVVATSDPSKGDFLVTGDAVNMAARLQQAANPDEVLVSERTADAAQAAFQFGRERAIRLKGKGERLRARPLAGPREARRRTRPPFVGRRQDLAQLALLRDRALEERQPQLVSILAPAGTGKTRLLEEFLARLDPAAGFQVAVARCPPYGQTLAYWPLRGLLSDLLHGDITARAVAEAFGHGGHAPAEATRLAELVLATLGMEREGAGEARAAREAIFNAWRLLVEALARQAPRIVVFENLDWASDSLLDLVEHVMQPRTDAPLLIVALARPELLDRRPTWGGGRPSFTALALRPLSEEQTRELVERLADTLPAGAHERIVERSGGNPFFAIELTRALDECCAVDAALAASELPDTVHASVLARLDLLAPHERAVVQAASVAGREFRAATLRDALEGVSPEAIAAALDALLARDLIVPTEGGGFTFRHGLIREVAYGTLARAERMRLHARLAVRLEREAAERLDEYAELIAYHYREALLLARQSAVPLALPFESGRAVRVLRRAGELASRAGAFAEARGHLQSAITFAGERERGQLYELLGDSVYTVFGQTAVEAYRQALEQWRAGGARDPLAGARLHRKLLIAYLRFSAGDPEAAELERLRAEARRLAEEAGDEYERWRVRVAELFAALSWKIRRDERTAPVREPDGRAVALAAAAYFEARGDWQAYSEALDACASLAAQAGDHPAALDASRRRLAAPELPAGERGDVVLMIAKGYFNTQDYARCIAAVRDALAQVRPGESVAHLAAAISRAACAAWYTGRWDELRHFIAPAEAAWEQTQHEHESAWGVMWGYFVPLHVAVAREDRAAAEAAASALERLFDDKRAPGWHRLLAAYRDDDPRPLLDPDPDAWGPETPYPETLMFLSERGAAAPPGLLERAGAEARAERIAFPLCVVAIAEALAAGDDARLAAAVEAAEAHEMIPHAARMRVALAQRTGDHAHLERARPVLERLGDRQFLRRLQEVGDLASGAVHLTPDPEQTHKEDTEDTEVHRGALTPGPSPARRRGGKEPTGRGEVEGAVRAPAGEIDAPRRPRPRRRPS